MEKPHYHLEQKEIQGFLPHRAPFLLVDRILSITGPLPMDDANLKNRIGIKVTGLKNVSINEPFFQGHFPGTPIMPGVLIIETMAQIASFSMYPRLQALSKLNGDESFQCLLVGVDGARFRHPVIPGDTLKIETNCVSCRSNVWTFECEAFVGEKRVAEAKLMANIIASSEKRLF